MAVRTAEFKKGEVSTTKGQIKKHCSQCTRSELQYLELLVKSVGSLKLSKHAKEKQITINMNDIKLALRDKDLKNNIIEYNITDGDKRVLIRSKEKYPADVNGNTIYCNLCFVVSLITKEIVTAYYNSIKDKHDTINYRRYDKNLKIY